jgi:hypothetical protein
MTFADAEKACKSLNFAGSNKWRLPTVEELSELVDYTRDDPAINKDIFPDTKNYYYWTSTPSFWNKDAFWYVWFSDGIVDIDIKDYGFFVRPVRFNQELFNGF